MACDTTSALLVAAAALAIMHAAHSKRRASQIPRGMFGPVRGGTPRSTYGFAAPAP